MVKTELVEYLQLDEAAPEQESDQRLPALSEEQFRAFLEQSSRLLFTKPKSKLVVDAGNF